MSNKRINITELEFDSIKQNLKTFLSGQPDFTDYDFDGSNMSVLLDVLAYNTHYNAMYINMALNEMYLDSAARRNSVVSLAKGIGYLPKSSRCAKGVISFTLTGTSTLPDFAILPKFSTFRSQIDGTNYIFYTTDNHAVERNSSNQYFFSGINVLEGAPVTNSFLQNNSNRYRLTNQRIDLTTLVIKVQETTSSADFTVYKNGNQFVDIGSDSNVYFLREMDDGFYDISFGDNIVGRQLQPGNLVTAEYFVSSGSAPNGIRTLSYSGGVILGGEIIDIQLESPVFGGQDQEDIESIRSNAPNFWLSQNRAVTESDFKSIVLANYPAIRDIKVWGGEKNEPPVYGKVFISATTTENVPLSFTQKNELVSDVLDKFKVVSVIPEILDPEYIDVELDVAVYYNQSLTNKSVSDMKSLVVTAVNQYNNEKLRNFDSQLRNSELIRSIETIDNSITNVVPRLRLYKEIQPFFLVNHNYVVNIGNPIVRRASSVITNGFRYSGGTQTMFIDNNLDGTLNLFYLENNQKKIIGAPIGNVNYDSGIITITDIQLTVLLQPQWIVQIVPSSPDVIGKANNIVRLDLSKLKVTILPDQTNTNNYNFTNSRL